LTQLEISKYITSDKEYIREAAGITDVPRKIKTGILGEKDTRLSINYYLVSPGRKETIQNREKAIYVNGSTTPMSDNKRSDE